MNFETYLLFTTEEFVLDSAFISWIRDPQRDFDLFWTEFLVSCPAKRTQIEEAAFIVRTLQAAEEEIPSGRLDDILHRIQSKLDIQRRRFMPDGTQIWLNSGSQLSYPPDFSGNSREVYLSGEAVFDVMPDAEKPFFVITKDIKIKVSRPRFVSHRRHRRRHVLHGRYGFDFPRFD